MPLLFFRRAEVDPLPLSMSGVKLGERLLQIGVDDGLLAGLLAAKTGLSGTAAHVVSDEDQAVKARLGAKKAGVLSEIRIAMLDQLPYEDGAFDIVVIHSAAGQLAQATPAERSAVLQACRRVLRPGGRLVAIEPGTPSGLKSMFRAGPAAQAGYDSSGGTLSALQDAGFFPVRELGDREGLKFVEGLRTT